MNMISTDTNRLNPQTTYTHLSHTQTQVGSHPLNDPASRKSEHNTTYFSIQSTFSRNKTRTFCNNFQLNKLWMLTVHPTRTRNDPHTLTNPNQQPYLKYKLNTNTMVTIDDVPAKNTATPTDVTINTTNNVPPNINDLPPTNNTRPMHRTIGHAAQHKHYINWTHYDHYHKTKNPTLQSYRLNFQRNAISQLQYRVTTIAPTPTPQAPGADAAARPFAAEAGAMASALVSTHKWTQHLMRMGRILLLPATDAISLTIGNFHDAPLNARRIDKNVYPDRKSVV